MVRIGSISASLKTIMVVIVLAVVVAAGWGMWNRLQGSKAVDSFDACVEAGNPVQTSYPEVCSSGGRRFINPSQQ